MNINELEKLANEGVDQLPPLERRTFLRAGFAITGLFLGGSILSLSPVRKAMAAVPGSAYPSGNYPYKPHYSMVMRQNLCVDCQLCMDACVKTNHVPEYGYRTIILEQKRAIGPEQQETIFCACALQPVQRAPLRTRLPHSGHLQGQDHGHCCHGG